MILSARGGMRNQRMGFSKFRLSLKSFTCYLRFVFGGIGDKFAGGPEFLGSPFSYAPDYSSGTGTGNGPAPAISTPITPMSTT